MLEPLPVSPRWLDDPAALRPSFLTAGPDDAPRVIAPTFNRAVIMLTDAHTYHGYRTMRLPAGVTRRSIATYAYRRVGDEQVVPRTTGWVPDDAGPLKRALARHYDTLVRAKYRW